MKILSRDRQNSIVYLLNSGLSGEKVFKHLGLQSNTVSKYKKQYEQNAELTIDNGYNISKEAKLQWLTNCFFVLKALSF